MRAILALVALAGCDFVFRIDHVELDGTRDGAVDGDLADGDDNCDYAHQPFAPVVCTTSFGTTPVEQSELAGEVIGDPTLRGDGLELYFTASGGNPYTIRFARRSAVTDPFQIVGTAPFVANSASDSDPAIDAKGEYLAFLSTRGGTVSHGYLAHRACTTWELAPMPGLETITMTALELSWDALTLYYVDASHDLYQADRPDTISAFGTPIMVAQNVDFHAISSDERELYYTQPGVGGIYRAIREADSGVFGEPGSVSSFGRDPDVSHDGTVLLLARAGDSLEVIRRTCPSGL